MSADRGALGWRGYLEDAKGAFRQAPIEVVVGIAVAVGFSVAVRGDAEEEWARWAAGAALAFPLLFGASGMRARGGITPAKRWLLSALILIAAAAYALLVFDEMREAEVWRYVALLASSVLAGTLSSVVGVERDDRRRAFWRFNAYLIARVVTVGAYGAALFAALAGAVGAITTLFDLSAPEELYGDLAGAVFFALVPWLVVGGLRELVARGPLDDRAPRPVSLLGRYLYAPVLAVYLAILITYAVRVVVTGEVPKNLLSPIILAAGVLGFIGAALLAPLHDDPDHPGVARLIRLLPAVLLVLLPFGIWAVWERREQYGWTEFRYLRLALLIALVVLAAHGTLRLLRQQKPLLLSIPLVLGATLLLSSFGPWGAVAVSRASQTARLRAALEGAGLMTNGGMTRTLAAPTTGVRDTLPISADRYSEIAEGIRYLYAVHGPESLTPILGLDPSSYQGSAAVTAALGVYAECDALLTENLAATLPVQIPIADMPGGTLHRIEWSRGDSVATSPRLEVSGVDLAISMVEGGERWLARIDLRPVLLAAASAGAGCSAADGRDRALPPALARRAVVDSAGRTRGTIVITRLFASRGPTSDRETEGAAAADSVLQLVRVEALLVLEAP